MKTSPSDWVDWDKEEGLPFSGGLSVTIRTNTPCTVVNEYDLILGHGIGEQVISVTGDGIIYFQTKGRLWLRPSSRVQERLQRSTEIFTSLDRPAPMSPEMLAIQRMMRKNEIERENDRREMEKRYADRERKNNRPEPESDALEASSDKERPVRPDPQSSKDDPKGKAKPAESPDAEPAGVSGDEKS